MSQLGGVGSNVAMVTPAPISTRLLLEGPFSFNSPVMVLHTSVLCSSGIGLGQRRADGFW